ncbi:MAG TPA: geranylgeranylglycerol-phosphate geranylgeranyltransferase, partial [Bacteroidales bacterium]
MKHYLQLIRLPNLLIMALTMVLIRYCIIQPIFTNYYINLELPLTLFVILVLVVAMIAAAGYMINDYFDVKTDLVNRPDKVVIGKYVKASTVYRSYFIINGIALLLSFYVSFRIGITSMTFLFPLVMGILWFYSTTYKRQLVTGNILVSLLIAGVPILVALYEMPLIHAKYAQFPIAFKMLLKIIFGWCGAYAIFAFIVNLIREFVKDMEDFEGDMAYGRRTLPIVFGLKTTKIVVAGLIFLTIVLIELVFLKLLEPNKLDLITFMYFHVLLILP